MRRQVVGLQIGQIADYVTMVSLAEPDLDAPLGTAPTILRLFAALPPGEDRPAGLSPWDAAFLKALYGTTLSLITQRSTIADRMLRDLAP